VTRPFAPIGSATTFQSSTTEPPSAPSSGSCPSILHFGASFHMTSHFAHLSSLCSSLHLTIHAVDGSPLAVAGKDTLCSDSFYVHDVSLISDPTMQFMSIRKIVDHDCCVIIDPNFFYIHDRRASNLVSIGPHHHDLQCLWELD
jgi:hypothetical protein